MNNNDMKVTWFVRSWFIFWMIGALHMYPNHPYFGASCVGLSVMFSFNEKTDE